MGLIEPETVAVEPSAVVVQLGVIGIALEAVGYCLRSLGETSQGEIAAGESGIKLRVWAVFDKLFEIRYGFEIALRHGV